MIPGPGFGPNYVQSCVSDASLDNDFEIGEGQAPQSFFFVLITQHSR